MIRWYGPRQGFLTFRIWKLTVSAGFRTAYGRRVSWWWG